MADRPTKKTPETISDALRNGFIEIAELVPDRFSDLTEADLIILSSKVEEYIRNKAAPLTMEMGKKEESAIIKWVDKITAP